MPKDELVDDFVRALVDLPPSESGDEAGVLAVAAFRPERVVVAEIGGSQRMTWITNDGAERGCGESVAARVALALVEEPVADAFAALAWLEDGFAEVADGLRQNAGIEEWLLECLVGIGQRHGGRRADDPVRMDGQNDEAESRFGVGFEVVPLIRLRTLVEVGKLAEDPDPEACERAEPRFHLIA